MIVFTFFYYFFVLGDFRRIAACNGENDVVRHLNDSWFLTYESELSVKLGQNVIFQCPESTAVPVNKLISIYQIDRDNYVGCRSSLQGAQQIGSCQIGKNSIAFCFESLRKESSVVGVSAMVDKFYFIITNAKPFCETCGSNKHLTVVLQKSKVYYSSHKQYDYVLADFDGNKVHIDYSQPIENSNSNHPWQYQLYGGRNRPKVYPKVPIGEGSSLHGDDDDLIVPSNYDAGTIYGLGSTNLTGSNDDLLVQIEVIDERINHDSLEANNSTASTQGFVLFLRRTIMILVFRMFFILLY